MANFLKIEPDEVVGKLLRFWIWADQQSISGNGLTVTKKLLDRITYCPGFADSLVSVGWLTGNDGVFCIPNFDRHNGESAKSRATTQKRVKKYRTIGNENVTPPPLPEKRREEKNKDNSLPGAKAPRPRDLIFDAIVANFFQGPLAKADGSRIGKLAATLRERGASPEQVAEKKSAYIRMHPDWDATPEAVVKHWPNLIIEKAKPRGPSF